MLKKEVTLAIESSVAGGSLSLFFGEIVQDRWVGETEVSRSEDLISAVSEVLRRNKLNPGEIDRLAVSRGPGSFTGARIGLATALGLKNGLNIPCFGVSLFKAFFYKFGVKKMNETDNNQEDIITAVSFGKNEVCFRYIPCRDKESLIGGDIDRNEVDNLQISSIEEFISRLNSDLKINEKTYEKKYEKRNVRTKVILNEKLHLKVKGSIENLLENNLDLVSAGTYLSDYIGKAFMYSYGSDNLTPFYIYK